MAAGKQARGYDWIEMNHVKNVQKAGHPCPMPLALAERLVLATTKPGDLVCDPFCGSGTVLVAAAMHGRRWLGCDLDASYLGVAQARLEAL
jgi:DNA modification methylase